MIGRQAARREQLRCRFGTCFRGKGRGMAGRKRSALVATGARGELAQALRQLRDERGMTLRQVAARSGYSAAALSMAESGRRLPSWEALTAFVESCGADPAQWRPLWQSAARSGADPVPGTRQRPEPVPGGD